VIVAVLDAINICFNYVFYISICCFSFILAVVRQLHTYIATDPAFFYGSQKPNVGFGLSTHDVFLQALSKQETAIHAASICGLSSKLLPQLRYS